MCVQCTYPLQSCSDYDTTVDTNDLYHDTQAKSGVGDAVWQLMLALLIKAILTIFTFGMKVQYSHVCVWGGHIPLRVCGVWGGRYAVCCM